MFAKGAFVSDKDGDMHYDVMSAFQKSIRGSDVNAALHYLARLIEAGDLPTIVRRLLVISYEDVGLASPNAGQRTLAPFNRQSDWGSRKREYLLVKL